MIPPRPALNYEYKRAVTFLRLHFHQSNELGVIEEDSCYSFSPYSTETRRVLAAARHFLPLSLLLETSTKRKKIKAYFLDTSYLHKLR